MSEDTSKFSSEVSALEAIVLRDGDMDRKLLLLSLGLARAYVIAGLHRWLFSSSFYYFHSPERTEARNFLIASFLLICNAVIVLVVKDITGKSFLPCLSL